MSNWAFPNTILGAAAEGANYFPRPLIQGWFWREIKKGNHILFSAPRRVGKSSIMKFVANNAAEGFSCRYENIASDAMASEFYKRLFELVLLQAKGIQKLGSWFEQWKESSGIDQISSGGVKFSRKKVDYKSMLLDFVPRLKETGITIVLLLDEFPDVIKNIAEREDEHAARDVLQTLRSLRHSEDFKGHFILVLAGSIGLDHVVKEVDRIAVINDLYELNLPALTTEEGHEFIQFLVKGATMTIHNDVRTYMLERLEQAIPYFIQLLVNQCNDLLQAENRPQLTTADVDAAWAIVLKSNKKFADWDERLSDYFPKLYSFFHAVLTVCAHKGSITIQRCYDLGFEHGLDTTIKGLMDDVLVKDGYLSEAKNLYRFQSPLLRDWWKNRHPKIKRSKKKK